MDKNKILVIQKLNKCISDHFQVFSQYGSSDLYVKQVSKKFFRRLSKCVSWGPRSWISCFYEKSSEVLMGPGKGLGNDKKWKWRNCVRYGPRWRISYFWKILEDDFRGPPEVLKKSMRSGKFSPGEIQKFHSPVDINYIYSFAFVKFSVFDKFEIFQNWIK